MNRTMIALIAVSLGALLPVPAAEGSTTVCTEEAIEAAKRFVPSLVLGEASASVEDPCVTLCDGSPTFQAATASLDCGIPGVSMCPSGSYGLLLDGAGKCVTPGPVEPDPINPCPDGCVPSCLAQVTFAMVLAYQVSACEILPSEGNEPPPGEDCEKEEDDNGFGGTHVSCIYDCMRGDELLIYAEAHDKTWGRAEADGHTECGGAQADCQPLQGDKTQCVGASGEVALHNDRADCNGESHEAFDDPVTVACYSLGPSTICKQFDIPEVCNDGLAAAHVVCLAPFGDPVEDEGTIARLLSTIPADATSFVVFEFDASSAYAIGSTITESGSADCWTGEFVFP